ncbi:unnamed protein product [Caenorhabditis bovis]|uniref:Uncharacterized protein n=1 Tax=Caenorhabditis bovis TaxID=2654633 RepID=A0A8S1EHA7_9PELO|nr:unnamed protein product [Caenorhabditis bovis]
MATTSNADESSTTPFTRNNSRTGSLRRFVRSSFRRTRKIFGIERNSNCTPPSNPVVLENVEEVELETTTLNRNDVLRVTVTTVRKPIIPPSDVDDKIFPKIRPVQTPASCQLVRYFPKEGRSHDYKCTLNSFERKRRSHQVFGLDHHAKEQLFCPLQASQIEFAFKSVTKIDVIVKIQAPNGETSGYINPKTHDYTSFTPSNIGCGHGMWLVHIAARKGCKFHHEYTKQISLVGQGVLFFEIDSHLQLREVERLWLDCLN